MYQISEAQLPLFTYLNDNCCQKPIRGIVLDFHGLGGGSQMISQDSGLAQWYGENHLLYLIPYDNPWSWMNDTAVKTVDLILDAVQKYYDLSSSVPIIATGGSMGGLGSLIFTRHSRHFIKACAANCPVCDLLYHMTERPDLPRTIFSAFAHYPYSLEEAAAFSSPLHQAESMPHIPYFIVHGEKDQAVNKAEHSDRFVKKMLALGHTIHYEQVPGMEHCALSGMAKERYYQFILSQTLR
jgi:dipeptidyl aminopeptidase/acylaminoacyl peptidase